MLNYLWASGTEVLMWKLVSTDGVAGDEMWKNLTEDLREQIVFVGCW